MVDVAQLVEPRIVIPVVAGSIPVVHPIIPSESQHVFIFSKETPFFDLGVYPSQSSKTSNGYRHLFSRSSNIALARFD